MIASTNQTSHKETFPRLRKDVVSADFKKQTNSLSQAGEQTNTLFAAILPGAHVSHARFNNGFPKELLPNIHGFCDGKSTGSALLPNPRATAFARIA